MRYFKTLHTKRTVSLRKCVEPSDISKTGTPNAAAKSIIAVAAFSAIVFGKTKNQQYPRDRLLTSARILTRSYSAQVQCSRTAEGRLASFRITMVRTAEACVLLQ